ncbi:hypothetical protein PG997_015081 [Apiospora hydei]|uniref:Fungal N-terminal domain-containing protein n=1 Tax=Apiospora hydei TaxID=1337664 RepID=A0ABR1UVM5_9PEZI
MADPLSVAGLAAGLVSLGLQVAGGIASYLDAIKGRSDELASVARDFGGIRLTLAELESICSHNQAQQNASGKLRRCIEACKTDLATFDDISSIPQGATQSPDAKFYQKLQEKHRQLVYPLKHRPRVEKFESRIHKLHGSLQTSLQAVVLYLTLSSARSVESMHMDVTSNRSETQALSLCMREIQDTAPQLRTDISNLEPMFRDILDSSFESHDEQLQALSLQIQELAQETKLRRTIEEHALFTPSTLNGQPPSPNLLVGRLVSKQGSLGSLSREAALYEGLVSCDCPIRKSRLHTRKSWWSAAFFTQTEEVKYHLPGCRFSVSPADERYQTYGFAFTGLQRILSKAVQVSISLHSRAGAFSVVPMIKYHAMVDKRRAPAFRLISLLREWLAMNQFLYVDEDEPVPSTNSMHWDHLVSNCLSCILQLFQQGRAHPTDVDDFQASLILEVMILINKTALDDKYKHPSGIIGTSNGMGSLGQFIPGLLVLLKSLVACGVPTMTHDRVGWSPLRMLLDYPYNDGAQAIAAILASEGNEVVSISYCKRVGASPLRFEPRENEGLLWRLANIPVLAEACEFNPFFEAVLADDEKEASSLLLKNPAYMEDVTAIGQTAIHLAVGKPRCLRMLVQHTKPHLLVQEDNQRATPLLLAMLICRQKNCTILLEAGCSLMLHQVFGSSSLFSRHVKEAYASDLLLRRTELKQIAAHYLTAAQCEGYGLHSSSVLDANLSGVVESLEAMKVPFDPKLTLPRGGWYEDDAPGASVYHYVVDVEDAEMLYGLGFQDIAACTRNLCPPCVQHALQLPYAFWLYRHGADDTLQSIQDLMKKASKDPSRDEVRGLAPGTTGAHCIARSIGDHMAEFAAPGFAIDNLDIDIPAYQEAAKAMASPIILADVTDGCLAGSVVFVSPDRRAALLATRFSAFLDLFDGRFSTGDLKAAIRFLTHEAMGLRHTCCGIYRHVFITRSALNELYERDGGDADGYVDEHERLHQVLAALFDELDSFDPEVGVDIQAAQKYIGTIWVERMESELGSDSDEDFDELVERTREMGIVWGGPLKSGTEPDVVDDEVLKARIASLDSWVGDVDKITRDESISGGCADILGDLKRAKRAQRYY